MNKQTLVSFSREGTHLLCGSCRLYTFFNTVSVEDNATLVGCVRCGLFMMCHNELTGVECCNNFIAINKNEFREIFYQYYEDSISDEGLGMNALEKAYAEQIIIDRFIKNPIYRFTPMETHILYECTAEEWDEPPDIEDREYHTLDLPENESYYLCRATCNKCGRDVDDSVKING